MNYLIDFTMIKGKTDTIFANLMILMCFSKCFLRVCLLKLLYISGFAMLNVFAKGIYFIVLFVSCESVNLYCPPIGVTKMLNNQWYIIYGAFSQAFLSQMTLIIFISLLIFSG